MSSIFLLLFLLLFLWYGISQLWMGISSTAKAIRAKKWPIAHANLNRIKLVKELHDQSLIYSVNVKYTYHVAGIEYLGDTLSFGYAGSNIKGTHQKIYDRFKYVTIVKARYNPANPAEACLIYGVSSSHLFRFVFGTIWILFTILIGVVGFTMINDGSTINNNSEHVGSRISTILLMCGDGQWGEAVCQDINLTTEVASVFDNYFKNGRNHNVAALDFMEAIEACGFDLGCIDKTIKNARKAQK